MSPAKMEKAESAIRAALAYREAFNRHDIEKMLILFTESCIIETYHPAPNGLSIQGKTALHNYWQDFFSSHTNIHLEIEEIFGFGERCMMRWQMQWINNEGGEANLRGVDIFKTRQDLINEIFTYAKSGNIIE